ncbi:MAG TPA: flagellar basal body-associated FliL family protein [Kofleriaceae bacterium]|nr:flagellar basal body-associated FliL family protein [Kofleriaceae bacterium]
MSEEAPPLNKAVEPPSAKTSKAVLGLLVVNLLATGFVAFKVVSAPPPAAAGEAHHAEADPSSEVTGLVADLDPFIVNLDEPGISRYLKITLELELMPKVPEEVIAKNKQLIRDTVLSHLSGLHVKDTLGAEAKDKIRTDLMAKLTKLFPDKIRRMFFQEFVVQ